MQLLKPKPSKVKKIKNTAGNLTNAAIAGGGTGALVGLLAKPKEGAFQKKVALGGAALYAGASALKSLRNRKKKV